MLKDTRLRSLTKAITWRVVGTLDTILLAFIFTQDITKAISIGLTEVLSKIIIFYFHERIWNFIRLGRSSDGPKIYRSLTKTISWRITGTLDTILLTFLFTGQVDTAISVGVTEVATKLILYFIHERVWAKVKWGRVSI